MKMSRVMRVALVIISLMIPILEYAASQTEEPKDDEIVQRLQELLNIILSIDE